MKKGNDEEIQQLIELGLNLSDELSLIDKKEDIERYNLLFEKLKEEPVEGLPFNFAAKVKARVQTQINRKKDIRFYLATVVIFLAGMAAAYGLLSLVNANAGNQFYTVTLKYKWVFVLGFTAFLSVLYMDQKLVKDA